MDSDAVIASLQQAVPGAQVERVPSADAQPTMYVSREELPAIARALRETPSLGFDFLAELTAVDFWPRTTPR